jgi:two-component system NtrC family sensor kinase
MQDSLSQDFTLAALVHDLKNVFETIGDAAELLAEDPQWSHVAGAINRAVERGQRIANSFQEAADTFELEAILANAIQSTLDFLLTSRTPALEFVRHIEPGIRLGGRPASWERVFVNLFLNSARAMRKGGTIEISARRHQDNIEIVVCDTGPGIPEDILGQVFRRGFSTDRSRTGLGLSIVEAIVREQGGEVMAGNREGGGARIAIRVPDLQVAVPG